MHSPRFRLAPIALLLALVATPSLADDQLQPTPYEPPLAALITSMMASEHYSGHPLDDEISERWSDDYMRTLDYNRMFFLASDVASFEKYRDTLDDAARAGTPDLPAAFHIHDVYRERVQQRVDEALKLLDQPIDWTVDESFDLDRSDDPWPTTDKDAQELWRKRIKEQVLQGMLQGETEDSQRDLLRKRYKRLETDILSSSAPDVFEEFMGAFTQAYDPHSDYFKPSTNEDFDIHMSNSLQGIGATLQTEGEYTKVVSLVPGGPAQQDGELQPGDRIVKVAQGDDPAVDVVAMRIDRVVKLIRGPKGTVVRLTVIPADAPDAAHTDVISITRDEVELTADDASQQEIDVPDGKGGTVKVGVINVPSFYEDFDAKRRGDPNYKSTTRDVRKLIDTLEQDKVAGIVLDLRKNGGGSLSEAVSLTGLFIAQGPVVQIGDRQSHTEAMFGPDPGVAWNGPLMVLTSPLSASASEILAGAIQDYGRGLIVGSTTTHGKGTVQNVIDLDPVLRHFYRLPSKEKVAGALKVTTHKFYRISGGSTQLKGVHADIVLPSPYDGLDLLESDLHYALSWDRVSPLKYHHWADLHTAAQSLGALSKARVSHDPDFAELDKAIKTREDEGSVVSLNLAKRKAEVQPPKDPSTEDGAAEGDKKDHKDIVLDEATRIMRDWIQGGITTAQSG